MATSPAMPTPIYDELLMELALEPEDDSTAPAASGTGPSPTSES